jgi:hypothetical protein
MDMRVVGVPVIDSNPVKFGSKIPLHIHHQLPRESTQVVHLSRVLRRNDEAEVVTIFLTSPSEGTLIGDLGSYIEQTSIRAIAGNAIPLQIVDVLRKR